VLGYDVDPRAGGLIVNQGPKLEESVGSSGFRRAPLSGRRGHRTHAATLEDQVPDIAKWNGTRWSTLRQGIPRPAPSPTPSMPAMSNIGV